MIFKRPMAVFLGVSAQFVIRPVLAVFIARLFRLTPSLTVGLILAGAVPDAMASGVISYLADANVAYSVSLTCGTTIVSPAITPWLTKVLAGTVIEVKAFAMFKSIIMIVIIPMIIGLLARHRYREQIAPKEKLFSAISTLFIAFICGQVIALNRDNIQKVGMVVLMAVITLNVLGLFFGYLAGKLFRFDKKYCRSLAINVAMQNAGLGAVLAMKHIDPEAAIPNALFATWSVVSGAILAKFWNRRVRKEMELEKKEGSPAV